MPGPLAFGTNNVWLLPVLLVDPLFPSVIIVTRYLTNIFSSSIDSW